MDIRIKLRHLSDISLKDWEKMGPQLEILAKREIPTMPETLEILDDPTVKQRNIHVEGLIGPYRYTIIDYALQDERLVQVSDRYECTSDDSDLQPQD